MPNLTQRQIDQLREFRDITDDTARKRRKAALFAEIKAEHRIPKSTKLRVEIDNTHANDYAALKDANTHELLRPIQDYHGPRGSQAIKPIAAPMAAPVHPFPGAMTQAGTLARPAIVTAPPRDVKPAFAGITKDAGFERPAPSIPNLKLGSISLDDAMALLRIEGDTRESFSTTSEQTMAPVFIRGERLYFVL